MTNIEKELSKILKDQCPIKNLKNIMETTDRDDLNPDIVLESIDILKIHEDEIRRLRQSLELMYKSKVVQRYLDKKHQK